MILKTLCILFFLQSEVIHASIWKWDVLDDKFNYRTIGDEKPYKIVQGEWECLISTPIVNEGSVIAGKKLGAETRSIDCQVIGAGGVGFYHELSCGIDSKNFSRNHWSGMDKRVHVRLTHKNGSKKNKSWFALTCE